MVDVIGALRAYLAADADVAAEVGTRVYVGAVPREESASQPRKALLLRYSGGGQHSRLAPTVHPVIEAWCIGATYQEADAVYRDVYDAMRAIGKTTQGSVLLLACIGLPNGPVQITDEDTGWPVQIGMYQVMAGIN